MSSNYPNMSYCAAENTKAAVDQLLELMNSGKKEDIALAIVTGKLLLIMYLI